MRLLLEGLTSFKNYSHQQVLGHPGNEIKYWHILRRGTVLSEDSSTLLLTPGCLVANRGENPYDVDASYLGLYTASGDALVERLEHNRYHTLPIYERHKADQVLFSSLAKTYSVLFETRKLMDRKLDLKTKLEMFFQTFGTDDLELPSQKSLGNIIGCSLEALSREMAINPEVFDSARKYFRRQKRQWYMRN